MKKIQTIAFALLSVFGMASCSLNEAELFDQKDAATAYSSVKDIENGMNGAYYYLGQYRFLGNYATSIGDFASGVSMGSSSSGHMYNMSDFTFSATDEEFEDTWAYGYYVLSSATKTIAGANELIEAGKITESEMPAVSNYMAQCYALKALTNFYLVNYFALPYSQENLNKEGIVIIDKQPTEAFAQVKRGTIAETYAQILSDIKNAESCFEGAGDEAESQAYYMTPMGVSALKARVAMAMGNYSEAKAAALEALKILGKGNAKGSDLNPSNEEYLINWAYTAINPEDIFTIKKSEDDNLSANSLNTLYGSYEATTQNAVIDLFGDNDIRLELIADGEVCKKYNGAAAQAVTNIPVFRKSEMALILAECYAREGDIETAKDYVMYTAKRDADMTADQLPADKEGLLAFIADETVREFFAEGHRFFEARRLGLKISGDNFSNWDIKNFCFPIPEAEINTGTGCTQNNWFDYLPQR